jgi:hypothetical protein
VLNQIGETFAGRVAARLGIKEVADDIWLVSFMHCDLEYFDLEQKTLQPLDNPFGARLSPMSRYVLLPKLCARAGQNIDWRRRRDSNPR